MKNCSNWYLKRHLDNFPATFHFPTYNEAVDQIRVTPDFIKDHDCEVLENVYLKNIATMPDNPSNVLNEPLVWTHRLESQKEELFVRSLQNRILEKVKADYCIDEMHFDLSVISRMKPGHDMIEHCDNADYLCSAHGEHEWNDGDCSLGVWKPLKDRWHRDLSVILYFGVDSEGGELFFPQYGIKVESKRGCLVTFPSNRHFIHSVLPVWSGDRYAFSSWITRGKSHA